MLPMKYDVFRKVAIGVFFLGLILILSGTSYAQDWAQTYGGGNDDDEAWSIICRSRISILFVCEHC